MLKLSAKKKPSSKLTKFIALLEWVQKLDPATHQISINLYGEHEMFARKTWWRFKHYISRVSMSAFIPKGRLVIYYKPPKTKLTIISGFAVTDLYTWKILDPAIITEHHKIKRGHVWVNTADAYPDCPIRRTNLAPNRIV